MTLPIEKRCVHLKLDGEQCKVPSAYEDHKCIFHSETEAAVQARREGRLKGARKSEHSPVVWTSDVPYLNSLRDVIKFLNRQLRKSLMGEISQGQFETSLQGCGALLKCFEVRDVRGELEKLEDSLEVLQQKMAMEKPTVVSEVEEHEQGED